MSKRTIDIGWGDLDITVEGKLVLHIGQVSDDETINLFLYPQGELVESVLSKEEPDSRCTHEILLPRR